MSKCKTIHNGGKKLTKWHTKEAYRLVATGNWKWVSDESHQIILEWSR